MRRGHANIRLTLEDDCILIVNPNDILVRTNRLGGSIVTHIQSKDKHAVKENSNVIQTLITNAQRF